MAKKEDISQYLEKINAYANGKREVVSTGFPKLDEIMGGGFPIGRSIEIFGDESGGKSSLSVAIAGDLIRSGKKVLLLDTENSYMPEYAEKLGCDPKKLHVMKTLESGEDTLDALGNIIKEGMVDVVIVDSMTNIVPHEWLENAAGQGAIGRQAAMHGRFLYQTRVDRISNDVSFIFVHQTRAPIGETGPYTIRKSSASTQILHEFHVRIRMSRSHQIKDKDGKIVGYQYRAEIVKNKVGPVKGSAILHYMIDTGFDKDWDLLDYAVEKEVVEKDGANFSFAGEKIAYGEGKAVAWMRDNDNAKKIKDALGVS